MYFLAIMCCKNRLSSIEKQKEQLKNIEKYPIVYYYFIGNLEIENDYEIDEKKRVVTLKCPDDYINLPNKTYNILKFVKEKYPNIQGIFKTDDDININIAELYKLLEEHKDIDYWGRRVINKGKNSNYFNSNRFNMVLRENSIKI